MTTYYFSSSGSNSNSGTSSGSPWYDVHGSGGGSITINSGDQFLFKKGDVWTSMSALGIFPANGVTTANVTIGTYGSGAAPVLAASIFCECDTYVGGGTVYATSSGWTISGLHMNGNSIYCNVMSGYSGVCTGVDISGCTNAKISIGTGASISITGNSLAAVYLSNISSITWNTNTVVGTGPFTFTNGPGGTWTGPFGDVVLSGQTSSTTFTGAAGNITATSNTGALTFNAVTGGALTATSNGAVTVSGCTLQSVQVSISTGAVSIDQNSVSGGGGADNTIAGPAGIQVSGNTSTCTIQRNAVYGIITAAAEGAGILVDAASSGVVVQYNLVYNCAGPGIHLYGSPLVAGHTGTVVRYNLTWHNCQGVAGGRYGELTISHRVASSSIYNNTLIAADVGTTQPPAVLTRGRSMTGVTIRNNILVSAGGPTVAAHTTALDTSAILFQGNAYWRPSGFSVAWYGTTYSTLAAWRAALTQEKNGGTSYGYTADPLFVDAVSTPAVTAPVTSIAAANGLKLQGGSPYTGAGLNLNSLFGTNIGTRDYFNTALSNPWSIGGAEY